jgi:hypothetical protein
MKDSLRWCKQEKADARSITQASVSKWGRRIRKLLFRRLFAGLVFEQLNEIDAEAYAIDVAIKLP